MSESKKLTKHDITMLGIRSSFLQASFNYERMQACGFLWSMLPVLKKIHGDDKEALSLAMTDNLEFINTHPNLVGFLMGLMMSLEEGGADHDTIKGFEISIIRTNRWYWRCDFLVYNFTNRCWNFLFICFSRIHSWTNHFLLSIFSNLDLTYSVDTLRI